MRNRILNILIVVFLVSGITMLVRISGPRLSFAPVGIENIQLLPVVAHDTPHHTAMHRLLAPYRLKTEEIMSAEIGTSVQTYEVDTPETPLTRLVAEVMLAEGRKQMPVDVAVSNIGGIRAPLYEGRITVGDVFKILPFDNALVVLSLRGATLDSLAADIVAKGGAALAGMTIEVRNGVAYKVQVGGEPVDAEKIYNVVTNDYLSWGNDGFTSMASYTAMHNMNMMLRDAMLNYIQSHPQQQAVIAPTDKCLIYTMP